VGMVGPASSAASSEPTEVAVLATNLICSSFKLHDQFGQEHSISFPRTNITVLTIADRRGNAQVNSWIGPLRERYEGQVSLLGIADVSEVPSAFHNAFERRFRKLRSQPVMLDWKGVVTKP